MAGHRHGLPVWSVLVLLRPAADGPELTGEYEQEVPGRGRNLWFRYDVVRVWELPPDRLLAAGPAAPAAGAGLAACPPSDCPTSSRRWRSGCETRPAPS